MSVSDVTDDLIARNRQEDILQAAYEQIILNGIVGFRILDVADTAGCSASLIYRHFGNRDGLIKSVLGGVIERHVDQWIVLKQTLQKSEHHDITAILEMVPTPNSENAKSTRWLRIQALAASVHNPDLNAFLVLQIQRYHDVVKDLLIDIRHYLGLTEDCDLDVLAMMWSTLGLMLTHNDMITDGKVDDVRFRAFLKKILLLS